MPHVVEDVGAMFSAACEQARSRASLALDCELSQVERADLRRHLAQCPECAVFVAGLREVTQELRTAPLPRPSRAFVPRRRRRAIPALLGVAAVLSAAAAGGAAGALRDARQPVQAHATGAQFAALFSPTPARRPAGRLPLRVPV